MKLSLEWLGQYVDLADIETAVSSISIQGARYSADRQRLVDQTTPRQTVR